MEGSHTNAARLSAISSLYTSTPYQHASCACFCRSLLSILLESKPALEQSCLGICSSALAILLIMSCSLPGTLRE